MRKSASNREITIKAYAGVTGILLAFNLVDEQTRGGLLGFAIERKKHGEEQFKWLCGMLPFPGQPHESGEPIETRLAPVQKFRWSDYAVRPGTEYTYRVHPVYGTPENLDIHPALEITIQTEIWDIEAIINQPGTHHSLFNRAAGASQAFAREFPVEHKKISAALSKQKGKKPGTKSLPKPSPKALEWLSRGVKEGIIKFIEQAKDSSYAIDVAIYQYELPEIVNAVNAALERNVKVRLLYHAKPGDKQTAKNEASAKKLPKTDKQPRKTQAIFHHKFIVLSRTKGEARTPIGVLAGSTNFTFNGVYCQANNIFVSSDAEVAQKYLDQFEAIFEKKETVAETKARDTNENVLDPSADFQVGFSPRQGKNDLKCFAALIDSARQDVFFSTAFNLEKSISDALLGRPHDAILRYGVQDKASTISGIHADRTAQFAAASKLPTGLDGWLHEQNVKGQTGNILIHTKCIVVDFTSDIPIIITGSHNFSTNASEANDENYTIIRGNTRLADTFGCEIMRIYDHYRFRFVESQGKSKKKNPPRLTPNNDWLKDYFDPKTLKYADRMIFSGAITNHAASAAAHAKQTPGPSVQRVRSLAARAGK